MNVLPQIIYSLFEDHLFVTHTLVIRRPTRPKSMRKDMERPLTTIVGTPYLENCGTSHNVIREPREAQEPPGRARRSLPVLHHTPRRGAPVLVKEVLRPPVVKSPSSVIGWSADFVRPSRNSLERGSHRGYFVRHYTPAKVYTPSHPWLRRRGDPGAELAEGRTGEYQLECLIMLP